MPGTDVSEGTTGVSVGNAVGVCSISVKTDMLVGAVLVFNSDEMFPQAVNKMVKIIQKYCLVFFFNFLIASLHFRSIVNYTFIIALFCAAKKCFL